MNPKTKGILPFLEVCYKPRTWAGFANLSVNWGQVSPKCRLRFEQNGLGSKWQGGIYDSGWKPAERLICNQGDLGCGYAWRACVYLKQNFRSRFREYEPVWAKTRRGLHDPAENRHKISRDFIAHPRWVQAQTQKLYPDLVSGSPTSLLTRCLCGWEVTKHLTESQQVSGAMLHCHHTYLRAHHSVMVAPAMTAAALSPGALCFLITDWLFTHQQKGAFSWSAFLGSCSSNCTGSSGYNSATVRRAVAVACYFFLFFCRENAVIP